MIENGRVSQLERERHNPVLVREIIYWLGANSERKADWTIIDCTIGTGALAAHILEASGEKGRMIGIDRDSQILDIARRTLAPYGERTQLVHGRFSQLSDLVRALGVERVQGIVMDLGVSSVQLSCAERGFSFSQEGLLDMRMDQTCGRTAAELLEQISEEQLRSCLQVYGEERYAKRIARAIVQERQRRPIYTTTELASLIERAVPVSYRYGRIHCATRTFQALRIMVNQELEELKTGLPAAIQMLDPGGRLCVIAFHSLEDRIVKHTFRSLASGPHPLLSILTKKPCCPTHEEQQVNPRARSAKLRVAERLGREGNNP